MIASIVGGAVSRTVTTELQLLLLPDASVTAQENGVDPTGKLEPRESLWMQVFSSDHGRGLSLGVVGVQRDLEDRSGFRGETRSPRELAGESESPLRPFRSRVASTPSQHFSESRRVVGRREWLYGRAAFCREGLERQRELFDFEGFGSADAAYFEPEAER